MILKIMLIMILLIIIPILILILTGGQLPDLPCLLHPGCRWWYSPARGQGGRAGGITSRFLGAGIFWEGDQKYFGAGRWTHVPSGLPDLQRLRGGRGRRGRLHEGGAHTLWGVWGQGGINITIMITITITKNITIKIAIIRYNYYLNLWHGEVHTLWLGVVGAGRSSYTFMIIQNITLSITITIQQYSLKNNNLSHHPAGRWCARWFPSITFVIFVEKYQDLVETIILFFCVSCVSCIDDVVAIQFWIWLKT